MRRFAASLIALFALLIAAVGCGGGGGGNAAADPAAAIPRNALLYAEAQIKPEGDTREGALAAAGKLLDTDDPAAKLREFVDKTLKDEESPDVTYSRDVAPWLGQRLGFWMATARSRNVDESFGLAVAVEDLEAGQDFLEREQGKDKKASYRGVDYYVDEDENMHYGLAGDYLLLGSPDPFKQMVDVLEGGGESLAKADSYKTSVSSLSDGRLGHAYLDFSGFLDLAAKLEPGDAGEIERFKGVLGKSKIPFAMGALANGERLALEMVTKTGSGTAGLFTPPAESSPLMGELPGDAWGAFAVPDVGKIYSQAIKQFGGAFGYAAIAAAVKQQTGLSIEEDILSWMGDIAFFVRGASVADIDGAVVIEVTDDAKATSAFGRLSGLLRARAGLPVEPTRIEGAETAFSIELPDAPKPVILARAKGRVVGAFGADAAEEALEPSSKLEDSDLLDEAREALGGDYDPVMVFSAPQILSLIESAGLSADPGYAEAKKYLDALSTIVIGGNVDGDLSRTLFAVGLK